MIRLLSGSHLSSPAGVKSTGTCSLSTGSIDRRTGIHTPISTGLHRGSLTHNALSLTPTVTVARSLIFLAAHEQMLKISPHPDKHVQLSLAPFLQFFHLNLARVADVQVVDSWSPSIPAGSSPH